MLSLRKAFGVVLTSLLALSSCSNSSPGRDDRLVAAEGRAATVSPSPCEAISDVQLDRLFDGTTPRSSGDSTLLAYRSCTWTRADGRRFEVRLTAEPSIADPLFERRDATPLTLGVGVRAVFVPDPLFLDGAEGASVVLRARDIVAFLQLASDRMPPDAKADLTQAARALAPHLRAGS